MSPTVQQCIRTFNHLSGQNISVLPSDRTLLFCHLISSGYTFLKRVIFPAKKFGDTITWFFDAKDFVIKVELKELLYACCCGCCSLPSSYLFTFFPVFFVSFYILVRSFSFLFTFFPSKQVLKSTLKSEPIFFLFIKKAKFWTMKIRVSHVNLFYATDLSLYTLKISINLWCIDVVRGCRTME